MTNKTSSKNKIVKGGIISAGLVTTFSSIILSVFIWRLITIEDPTGIKWTIVLLTGVILTFSIGTIICLTDLVDLIKKGKEKESFL